MLIVDSVTARIHEHLPGELQFDATMIHHLQPARAHRHHYFLIFNFCIFDIILCCLKLRLVLHNH